MTKLDRQLATLFRMARWPQSAGRPVCPKCYDGADVKPEPEKQRKSRPEVGTYFCQCCVTRFTDCSGTGLAHSTQPLRAWALALLVVNGIPTEYATSGYRYRDLGLPLAILNRMRAVWKGNEQLGRRWRAELNGAGISLCSLIYACKRAA